MSIGSHIRPSWSSLLYDINRIFAGLWNYEPVAEFNPNFVVCGGKNGAPGRIRTSDLLVRSQALYPAELRAHIALLQLGKNNRWKSCDQPLARYRSSELGRRLRWYQRHAFHYIKSRTSQ
jgi:hypothetical protein